MILWHIGNTTVRTPYRLRDALCILQASTLNGNISGIDQENAFASLLHDKGILNAPRVKGGNDASDLGRKWRSALSQLGFITPQLTRGITSGSIDPQLVSVTEEIEELSGRAYEITPNGYRLIKSDVITAQQECFLRALVSYQYPSIIERKRGIESFSPLKFILCIIDELKRSGQSTVLSFHEFAFFIQTSKPTDGIHLVAQKINDFRSNREKAKGNVKAYVRNYYETISGTLNRRASTLDDYADLTFRYLKATGLFRTAGRGIALSPSRAQLAELLVQCNEQELTDQEYLNSLWVGAQLPTDDAASSYTVVHDLADQLIKRGINVDIPPIGTPLANLENERHEYEAKLLQLDEQDYAKSQADKLDEINKWLEIIPRRGSTKLPDGSTAYIPRGEGPAYLEWIIWRAFLAIDSLCNSPWEARRFQIDQDFLPVHCAPGNGPDMVFEFDEAIIVVEVTLTASSRQEAAEGEPVRRHVAQYVERSTKEVYGLFIAVEIDSNTAHTFRSGDWYRADDTKLALDIVPLTLSDFSKFLRSGQGRLSHMSDLLKKLLIECRAKANQDAPLWKKSISTIVERISTA